MNHRTRITSLLAILISALSLTSCDDGYIIDPVYGDTTESFTVQMTGTLQSLKTWTGNYSVVLACFDGSSNYSIIQKVLPSDANDSTKIALTLSHVPTSAKTVEIAVVGSLRNRIATLFSYQIPDNQQHFDTIRIDIGTQNVGMFASINKALFQNTSINCARCHASNRPAAQLDLSSANAYSSLINKPAYKNPSVMRVKPYDAEGSYLYQVLTSGAEEVSYAHPALLTDHQSLVEIIKTWINGGAKE